jgi:hypothetical protein
MTTSSFREPRVQPGSSCVDDARLFRRNRDMQEADRWHRIPGPFPWTMERYTRPLYRDHDGMWPEIPDGCRLAGYCRDDRTGREWHRLRTRYMLRTLQEGIVFVGVHEVFHFLRHSRQIAGRNGENEADQFAPGQLHDFRQRSSIRPG